MFTYYKGITGFLILTIIMSCSTPKKVTAPVAEAVVTKPLPVENNDDLFFTDLFKNYPGIMDSVLVHKNEWNVQIIYTEINRDKNGKPILTDHYFNRRNAKYFYPASTVKLPVALLALEKLNELNIKGLNKYSTMVTGAAFSGQTSVYNDPNTIDGKPSVAQYIKKILLVSDNDAYNRLYEFLGQEHINAAMIKKGYAGTQLLHRLSIFLSEEENRRTNPVNFLDSNNQLLFSKPLLYNRQAYTKRNDKIGKGYYSNGKLIAAPMDFSSKNKIELTSLHQVLVSLIFPEAVNASQRFNISADDRRFMLQYMSQYPAESVYPYYDSTYYDAYVKFLLYGSENGKAPANIRIFNKVGNAYGQLIDVAYIVDFEKNIEFMVSAAIYCNTDEILNDDKYDYDSIGYPFLKNLGKILYDYELKRKRNYTPDLSPFRFKYDR